MPCSQKNWLVYLLVHIVHIERAQKFNSSFFETNIIKHPIKHPFCYYDLPNYKRKSSKKCIKVIGTKILKRIAMSFNMRLIDFDQFANNRFYKEIDFLIKSNNIANLITSTPPHSFNLVGLELKKRINQNIEKRSKMLPRLLLNLVQQDLYKGHVFIVL